MVLCGDVRDGQCRPLTEKRGYLPSIIFENLCQSYLSKGNFAGFLANAVAEPIPYSSVLVAPYKVYRNILKGITAALSTTTENRPL